MEGKEAAKSNPGDDIWPEIGLRCPKCEAKTAVYKTQSKPEKVRRKRHCLNDKCGCYFGTVEIVVEKSDMTKLNNTDSAQTIVHE